MRRDVMGSVWRGVLMGLAQVRRSFYVIKLSLDMHGTQNPGDDICAMEEPLFVLPDTDSWRSAL